MFKFQKAFFQSSGILNRAAQVCLLLILPLATNAATIVGGSTLMTKPYANQIETWLGNGSVTFTKIYTKLAGHTSLNFHAAVDNQGPTLVIMRATDRG